MDAEEIARRAREIPSDDERRDYLAEVCADDARLRAEVESLLSLPHRDPHEAGTADLTPPLAGEPLIRPTHPGAGLGPGDVIDRYKLLQLIGEGGFGEVFMAEQREPVQRRVALKLLKLGMDTKQVIARFEAERQALARMDHPNIARVIDAGSTPSGRPYFVMELVKGIPLLEYCSLEKIGTEQRLQLFSEVCMAIQHAHQKGIIHRDIKPSNVLVTMHDGRPVPKVIDFGIAKATSGTLTDKTLYTEFRHMIGTPAYMSPEQAEMSGLDVDTRSDIYSLGVLLYQLLTGTTPFDARELYEAGLSEMLRILREVEPERPSTRWSTQIRKSGAHRPKDPSELARIGRILRGDLDSIVMKCLEKDRQRRYDSASDLAADVLRYLRDEPVLASPPTTAYRMRKFVKRNRGRVIAGAALIAVLVLGAAGTTFGLVRAERERRATQRELARASEVKQLVADMLTSVRPEVAQGLDNQLMRKILVETEERLDRHPVADKEIEAELRQLIGVTYRHLALLEPAERELRKSVELWQSAAGPEHLGTLDAMNSLAVLQATQGRSSEAESLYRAVITTARGSLGPQHEFTLAVQNNLGNLLLSRGQVEEAGDIVEGSYGVLLAHFGEEDQGTLKAKSLLGGVRELEANFAEAEQLYREVLAIRRRDLGDDHPHTLESVRAMGSVLRSQEKYAEAETYYREALAGRRRIVGDDHHSTLNMVNGMAGLLHSLGRLGEAEPLFREALAGRIRLHGADHPSSLRSRSNLGALLHDRGDLGAAESLLREALEGQRRLLGGEHRDTVATIIALGVHLREQGRHAEAENLLREAFDARRRSPGMEHPETLVASIEYASLLRARERHSEALALTSSASERSRELFGPAHWRTGWVLAEHARAIAATGAHTEAIETGTRAHAILVSTLGEGHVHSRRVAGDLAELHTELHRLDADAGHEAQAAQWRGRARG